MGKTIHFGYHIDPVWDIIKQIRTKVESELGEYAEELRHASKMTASELIENAVKYGDAVAQGEGISFEFTATERQITIMVSNKIVSQEDADDVQRHIDLIHAHNPEELYLNRLQALMDDPTLEKSQLGLIRIAYEGRFTLSYTCQDGILTITAIRNIS